MVGRGLILGPELCGQPSPSCLLPASPPGEPGCCLTPKYLHQAPLPQLVLRQMSLQIIWLQAAGT